MCYSARIEADWRRYRREYGAEIALSEFYDLFHRRLRGTEKVKVPKALEVAFADPADDGERAVAGLIAEHRAAEAARLEEELFRQRKRLADAERALAAKPTKAAAESRRIATEKCDWILARLASLRTTDLTLDERRIFPGHYAPVIVLEHGRRVVRPMRYQCRLPGKPASHDARYPGTYNARRDSLGGYWKDLFGRSHAILVAGAFYENVARADGNVVLEFSPRPRHEMLVACLWARWSAPGAPDLLSFAAITDEPPEEVAAAGHDRCIVPIKPEHVDAWLDPRRGDLVAQQAILDDRERPYYEHRLAA